jgi:HEAT repeat protein
VVGSALRFFARCDPVRAVPLLEKALKAEEPIVRQNAVDELDEMNHRPALEKIKRLLRDPDKDVRQAARTAVAHLENGALGQ